MPDRDKRAHPLQFYADGSVVIPELARSVNRAPKALEGVFESDRDGFEVHYFGPNNWRVRSKGLDDDDHHDLKGLDNALLHHPMQERVPTADAPAAGAAEGSSSKKDDAEQDAGDESAWQGGWPSASSSSRWPSKSSSWGGGGGGKKRKDDDSYQRPEKRRRDDDDKSWPQKKKH